MSLVSGKLLHRKTDKNTAALQESFAALAESARRAQGPSDCLPSSSLFLFMPPLSSPLSPPRGVMPAEEEQQPSSSVVLSESDRHRQLQLADEFLQQSAGARYLVGREYRGAPGRSVFFSPLFLLFF